MSLFIHSGSTTPVSFSPPLYCADSNLSLACAPSHPLIITYVLQSLFPFLIFIVKPLSISHHDFVYISVCPITITRSQTTSCLPFLFASIITLHITTMTNDNSHESLHFFVLFTLTHTILSFSHAPSPPLISAIFGVFFIILSGICSFRDKTIYTFRKS